MYWYLQLIIYVFSCTLSFIAIWNIDFNKFIRISKKQFAIFVYIILSLALGYLIGKFFIEIGELIPKIN